MDKSNCCKAELKSISSDEGTGYYLCTKCNKPCDPYMEPSNMEDTKEKLIQKLLDIHVSDRIVIPNWSVIGKTGDKSIRQLEKEFGVDYKKWLSDGLAQLQQETEKEMRKKIEVLRRKEQKSKYDRFYIEAIDDVLQVLSTSTEE